MVAESFEFHVAAMFADGTRGPVPKARARTGGKRRDHMRTKQWEALVRDTAALHARGREPLRGMLNVQLTFGMPMPKSWSTTRAWGNKGCLHGKRPDVDNLAKAVMDGLQGVLFIDDGQVAVLTAEKRYAFEPGVSIFVQQVGSIIL